MRTPNPLSDDERKVLIGMRLEKAHQAASDAAFAMSEQRWLMAVNRIYYAMFYATSALALQDGFSTSKHQQLHGWFNKTYIATGLLDKSLNAALLKAYKERSDGDYEDATTFTQQDVQILFDNMTTYNATLEAFIRS
jgi:uncharacterized protein (UPF0332 family)